MNPNPAEVVVVVVVVVVVATDGGGSDRTQRRLPRKRTGPQICCVTPTVRAAEVRDDRKSMTSRGRGRS